MANVKITGLTAASALTSDDLLAVVDDPSGTPATKKATLQQVLDLITAADVDNTPSGNLAATTVQAALNELQTDVDTRAQLLAAKSHKSGAYSTTSTSFVDVDASNLAVTFTAPASGQVLVRLTAIGKGDSQSYPFYWGLREASADVSGSDDLIGYHDDWAKAASAVVISGLTGGNSYTWKWAFRVGNAALTHQLGAAGSVATMEIWSA